MVVQWCPLENCKAWTTDLNRGLSVWSVHVLPHGVSLGTLAFSHSPKPCIRIRLIRDCVCRCECEREWLSWRCYAGRLPLNGSWDWLQITVRDPQRINGIDNGWKDEQIQPCLYIELFFAENTTNFAWSDSAAISFCIAHNRSENPWCFCESI